MGAHRGFTASPCCALKTPTPPLRVQPRQRCVAFSVTPRPAPRCRRSPRAWWAAPMAQSAGTTCLFPRPLWTRAARCLRQLFPWAVRCGTARAWRVKGAQRCLRRAFFSASGCCCPAHGGGASFTAGKRGRCNLQGAPATQLCFYRRQMIILPILRVVSSTHRLSCRQVCLEIPSTVAPLVWPTGVTLR